MVRIRAPLCAAAVVAVLCSACGQYPNVHQRAVAEAKLGLTPGASVTGTGPSQGSAEPSGSPTLSPTPSPDGGSGGFTGTTSPPTDSSSSSGGPGSKAGQNSRTWDRTIVIGVHAPITGAAPVHEDSFDGEKGLFWRHGNGGQPVTVFGRTVRVVVQDDGSDPSQAQQACQEMVTQRQVFMLVGVTGADEIAACARYAQSAGVPYLSVGAAQRPLSGLGGYFAVSETYAQQASPLATYVKRTYTHRCRQVLMIAEDTANLDDAVSAFQRSCPGVEVLRVPVSANGEPYGSQLCAGTASAYRAVYPLTSPDFFLQMAGAARSCAPRYVGVGITLGIDAVAKSFCQQGGRSNEMRFFSPAPAFADSDRFDSRFRRAATNEGLVPDDVGWLLWELNATLDRLLRHAGVNLTRQGFVRTASTADVNVAGWGRMHFSPSNHFGGRSFSLLNNVCSAGAGHFETLRANVSGF